MNVGDLNSTERGSGARDNAGKPPLDMLPISVLADYLGWIGTGPEDCVEALRALGEFQSGAGRGALYQALQHAVGTDLSGVARVLDFGRKSKYAAWNWAKGMPWSVPLACAARHLFKAWAGEENDPESGERHRDHAGCNLLMLAHFFDAYPEGSDRPGILLAAPIKRPEA